MEENKRRRKNGPSRNGDKDVAAQMADKCPVPIQERCGLCHNTVLSASSPNDISVEDHLPDNICQCFSMNVPGEANVDNVPGEANVDNVSGEARFEGEQNAGQPSVQICDSRDANLDPVKEESRTEESNNISKNDVSSSEESKLLEYSFSSNGYVSSPSDKSFNPPIQYQRRTQFYPQPNAPTYQPHINPAINMSMPRPLSHPQHHTQPIKSYGNPTTNMPLNRTDIPRFPVSRPEMCASYSRRPDNDENASLSKKLLLDAEKDPEKKSVKTKERIEVWLDALPPDPNVPPTEEASASVCETALSTAENEGIPRWFSEISTDERSSTEISEEENRRQRSLRRPPRKNRK